MHKRYYASGFLYHFPTQQILLQQRSPSSSNETSPWSLFGGLYGEKEQPGMVFKKIIYDLLHVKIGDIKPVYSYLNEKAGTRTTILYSEIKKFQKFSPVNGMLFAWFSFKDVLRLNIAEQTKHDIVIGQRVIHAVERKNRGEFTYNETEV